MVRGPASSTTGPQRSSTNRLSNNFNLWYNVLNIEEKNCPITFSNVTGRCQMQIGYQWLTLSLCQPHGQCQWPHKIRCPCACWKYPIQRSYKILLTGPDQPAASFECRLLPSLLARDLPWCLSWKMSKIVNRWFFPKTSFTCETVTFSKPASALEFENVNWHTQIIWLKTTIIPCDIFQLCLGIWAPSASENIRQPRVQRFLIENHNCKMVTQHCSAKNLECLLSNSFENI